MRHVRYVVVKLEIDTYPPASPEEVVENCDYTFSTGDRGEEIGGEIFETEIIATLEICPAEV